MTLPMETTLKAAAARWLTASGSAQLGALGGGWSVLEAASKEPS